MTIDFADLDGRIAKHLAWNNDLFRQFRQAEEPWPNWPVAAVLGPEYRFVTEAFPGILSCLIANVDDEELRALLVGILYSKLGSGDFEKAHFRLFEDMLADAGVTRAEARRRPTFRQTTELVEGLHRVYDDKNIAFALGAQYALEQQADNMLLHLQHAFRKVPRLRQRERLAFFAIHEVDEPGHIRAMRKCLDRVEASYDDETIRQGAIRCLDLFAAFWNGFIPSLVQRLTARAPSLASVEGGATEARVSH